MRNGQNKRMRGRNRKSHNPLTRVYESNGPDVKIRGTASHVADKYVQLARDAQASGDPVGGRELFPARRALFPPDRDRAGAVPPEPIRSTGRRGERRRRRRATRASTTATSEGPPQQPQRSANRRAARIGTARAAALSAAATAPAARAALSAARRSRYGGAQPQQQQPQAQPDEPAGSRPAAVLHHRRPAAASRASPRARTAARTATTGRSRPRGDRFPLHRRRRRHRGPRSDRPARRAARTVGEDDGSAGTGDRRVPDSVKLRTAPPGDGASTGSSVRHQPALLAPRRYRAIDLLGRLDDVDAGERRRRCRAGALPGDGRAQEPAARDRRHVERLAPAVGVNQASRSRCVICERE